jgi:hypothetical protein
MKRLIPSPGLSAWYRKAKLIILSTHNTLHISTEIHRYWYIFKKTLLEIIKKFNSHSPPYRLIQEGET